MKKTAAFLLSLLISLVALPTLSVADTNTAMQRQLFGHVDQTLASAKQANANLLSPDFFARGLKHYKEAKESFHMRRNLDDVREDIVRAEAWLAKSMEATSISSISFASVIQARSNAKSAGAPKFAADLWAEAEKAFRAAAHDVEQGDIRDAKRAANDVSGMFQKAELTAIKVNYLGGARALIKQAEELDADKYAIKTLVDAKQLLQQAERELTENRYDTDYPRDLARQARNEAQHAITITKLAIGVKKKDFSVEDIITNYERPLTNIAGELDIVPSLHDGYKKTEQQIITDVRQLDKDSQQLAQCLIVSEERAAEIASLSEQLGIKSEKLAAEERYQALLADIEGIFDASEAEIFRQNKNMIIRMVALNFASGKAELKPDHLRLLTKVKQAVELSHTELITIEGHTDSYGGDESNLVLSEERAQAVVSYLQSHMTIEEGAILGVGYGETRPIANNESEAGREKNRRIDVVIQLTK